MPLLLVVGVVLGPRGVGVLTEHALAVLDPVIPVALAALGVLLGQTNLGTGVLPWPMRVRALAEATVTIGTVWICATLAAPRLGLELISPSLFAVAVALSAASSARREVDSRSDASRLAHHAATVDDVVLVLSGAVVLAVLREDTLQHSVMMLLHLCALALVVAAAGGLLLARTTSETEQRVFTFATLLLLAGTAEYLSLSALLCGFVAGIFWQRARGPAGMLIRRDLSRIQQPLIALVLVVAGAHVELSPAVVSIAIGYALLRAFGKLIGAWLLQFGVPVGTQRVAPALLSPGFLGVAFGLMLLHVDQATFSTVLAVTAIGAVVSEVLSFSFQSRRAQVAT